MSENVSTVGCTVDLYPFESSPISISGGQILSCSVQKSIKGSAVGTFSLVLAPGGPQGVDDPIPWIQYATPMSLCVIAMSRGSRAQVVMVGLVTSAVEAIEWGDGVIRRQVIRGMDFQLFFNSFNWATMATVGLTSASLFGAAIGVPAGGAAASFSPALFGLTGANSWANPVQIGQAFLKLMLAPGSIMGTTRVPYQNQTTILVANALATIWENFLNIGVPFGDYLATLEGDWASKFLDLFPYPWYEWFTITAPQGYYVPPGSKQGGSGAPSPTTLDFNGVAVPSVTVTAQAPNGTLFKSLSMPNAVPAAPTMVARVNPLPALTVNVSSPSDNGTFGNMDMTRWNALAPPGQSEAGMPTVLPFTPDSGVFSSSLVFDISEVRNTFYINPRWFAANLLSTGTNTAPVPFFFLMGGDAASVHRYGYRPAFETIGWLYDPVSGGTGLTTPQFAQTVATMLARLMSYYEPTPLMARSVATLALRPDLMPGFRFRYAPSKSPISWDFYIDAVQHDYTFGGRGPSTTTLQLSRGLPTSIYEAGGAKESLLFNIHTGNAQRTSNPPSGTASVDSYVASVPTGLGPALTTVNPMNNAILQEFLSGIATTYSTPGMK